MDELANEGRKYLTFNHVKYCVNMEKIVAALVEYEIENPDMGDEAVDLSKNKRRSLYTKQFESSGDNQLLTTLFVRLLESEDFLGVMLEKGVLYQPNGEDRIEKLQNQMIEYIKGHDNYFSYEDFLENYELDNTIEIRNIWNEIYEVAEYQRYIDALPMSGDCSFLEERDGDRIGYFKKKYIYENMDKYNAPLFMDRFHYDVTNYILLCERPITRDDKLKLLEVSSKRFCDMDDGEINSIIG